MKTRAILPMNKIPDSVKSILKTLKFKFSAYFLDKHFTELKFQLEWAIEFKENKYKVLKYWEKYRYLSEIKQITRIHKDTMILDVGCGVSTVLHFIEGKRYGIDPLANEYKKIYDYPEDICIQKAKGEDIPFPDNYFDVVICSNVLDHVTDPKKSINSILTVLRKNGFFVLTVELFEEKGKRDAAHPHSLNKTDVINLIGSRLKKVFEGESPWIGLRRYVNGERSSKNNELITVFQKV